MHARLQAEEYVATAVSALSRGPDCNAILDQLPVPLYTTDGAGLITYCNEAGAAFAGRQPRVGKDRWCITHKLYSTTGEPMPHEDCPMAEALQKKQAIRGLVAITERPDGTRLAFRPYPTPILNDRDELEGGVNILIDVTDEQSALLSEQADRCRRLAQATYDRATSTALEAMADGFYKSAEDLSQKSHWQRS